MMPQPPTLGAPPARTSEPVLHRSAGRDIFAQRYVIGWPDHGLVKIGSGSRQRVRRFLHIEGAELIDIAYYERLVDGIHSETWLQRASDRTWPQAWTSKADARLFMGNDTGGWLEFYAVPVAEWPELRRLAAL